MCIIQTNSFSIPSVGTLLGQAWADERQLPGDDDLREGTSKKNVCVRAGGGSSDLQARCTGQQGAGVAWRVAQPAPYPRADASDTAGRKE